MSESLRERWFEDFAVGQSDEFGDHLVTEAEIIEFAQRFDPQPFHVDPVAAAQSSFGGLVASGWMSCSVLMRMMCDHFISPASSMGSPGLDELRWLRPVRPGDRLHVRVSILEVRRSTSRPDRGSVLMRQELVDHDGNVALTQRGWAIIRCRP